MQNHILNEVLLLRFQQKDKNHKWEELDVINEHLEVERTQWSVLWGIFRKRKKSEAAIDNKSESKDNKTARKLHGEIAQLLVLSSQSQRDGTVFLLTRGSRGADILFRATIKRVVETTEAQNSSDWLKKIPAYYDDRHRYDERDISCYLEISKIEMVTIAYLGIYSLKNGHSLRKALKGQSSVLFLKTKKEVRMAGFYPANKTPEAALATIHRIYAIRIHNYLGIKDITLSFSSDKRYSWMPGSDTRRGHWDISDTPNKTYNIFEEDGIADLTCILGKNGVGKSRIIKMMLNYIAWWQNLQMRGEIWEFDMLVCDRYGRFVTISSLELGSEYIGKIIPTQEQPNGGNVALDFSCIANVFISNVASDPYSLETNTVMYWVDLYEKWSTTCQYLGVMPKREYISSTANNNLNTLLFLILLDKNYANLFREIVESVLGRSFVSVKLSILKKKDIPSSLKAATSLYELLAIIKNGKLSESFFADSSSRRKLQKLVWVSSEQWGVVIMRMAVERRVAMAIPDMELIGLFLGSPMVQQFFENIPLWSAEHQETRKIFGKDWLLQFLPVTELLDSRLLWQVFQPLFSANIISLEILDKEGNSIREMSTGERSIVMTIIKMLYSMMENKNKSIVFYMDEPDVFLHPEWQRRLIDALATVTRRTLPKRLESNLHIDQNKPIVSIVTTTHSPIIISDIPRENIIALDKTGKDGKIQRASLEHETFLNNLFANYADAFHVESFLGEYARKKFATKTKAGDKDFLDIIGDDFLQNYMKHKWNK